MTEEIDTKDLKALSPEATIIVDALTSIKEKYDGILRILHAENSPRNRAGREVISRQIAVIAQWVADIDRAPSSFLTRQAVLRKLRTVTEFVWGMMHDDDVEYHDPFNDVYFSVMRTWGALNSLYPKVEALMSTSKGLAYTP